MRHVIPNDVVGVGGEGRLDVVGVLGCKVTIDQVQRWVRLHRHAAHGPLLVQWDRNNTIVGCRDKVKLRRCDFGRREVSKWAGLSG